MLSVLAEGDLHAGGIAARLRARGPEHAAAVTRGGVQSAVRALLEEGWVEPVRAEVVRSGQVQTTFAITEAGRAHLVRRLDAEVRVPQREYSRLIGTLPCLSVLGARGTVEALAERAAQVRRLASADRARLAAERAAGVPRLRLLEAEYRLRLAEAEAAWAEDLTDEILGGAVRWPSPAAPQ
ncbi:hypothetical protein GCM10022221_50500 [Actinocorallia aurea]